MAHRLQNKIHATAHKARRHALLWGLCIAVSGIAILFAAGGALDYLVRFEDRGLRLLLSAALLAGAIALAWRFVYRRFIVAANSRRVATQLERHYPELRGQLTSALEFLDQPEDDPRAGSATLRRAVINRTELTAEPIDFAAILPKARTMQAGGLAILIIAALCAFCFWQPQSAKTAAIRLGNPLSNLAWPRDTNLQWKTNVDHVPSGGTFEVDVVDEFGAALPGEVHLEIRYPNEQNQVESFPMRFVDDVMRFRRENVVRPFEYRAVGGDDTSMAWTRLDVIEPPQVSSLELDLHPPQYTNWPVRESSGRVEALVGTYVALRGRSTKKLRSAEVVVRGGSRVPATIDADGFGFKIEVPPSLLAAQSPTAEGSALGSTSPEEQYFVVDVSGTYLVELTDENGYKSADQTQYEIRAVTDDQPRVVISEPQGDLVATSSGRLPISVSAADDLLLRDVELRYSRSDQTQEGNLAIPFFLREQPPQRLEDWPVWTAPDDTQDVNYVWELRNLKLSPGMRVTFYGVAGDFAGQTGQSAPRRLTIVTPEQLQERLAEEQAFVVDELARVLESQVAARGKLSEIEVQLRDVGSLQPKDVDALQSVELTQRNVERMLLDDVGIRGRVQRLLDLIRNNRLDSADMTRRMQSILDTVARISEQEFPTVEAALTAAVKDSQIEEAQDQGPLAQHVQQAGAAQDRVIHELETSLSELAQWNNYRRFFRDASRIRQDQAQLAQDVADMIASMLGKRPADLTEQEQTDLARLQSRHDDLARRLESLQGQMPPMIESLRDDDPLAADILSDALALAEQQAIGQQLRNAGNDVRQARGANALRSHETISELLQEMLDVLSNKREHELARLAKKLDQALQDLQGLQQRQAGLRKQMEQAAGIQDPEARRRELERLAEEQRKLQEEADRMARRLQRLQSSSASGSSASAARRMAEAAEAAANDDQPNTQQALDRAEQDLEQAQQSIQEQQEQIKRDLAEELVAKTIDVLQGLRDRQQSLLRESERIQQLRESQAGTLSRGQLMSLRDLTRDQEMLRDEAHAQAERLEPVPAFAAALTSAADQMDLAAILLSERDEATAALRQRDALRRLDQLLHALQTQPSQANGNQGGSSDNSNSAQQGSSDGIPRIAQLRLLKAMQEALNIETSELDAEQRAATQAGQPLTEAQRRRFIALATEQGRLADLIFEMSRPVDDDPLKDLKNGQQPNNLNDGDDNSPNETE